MASQVKKKKQSNRSKALKAKIEKNKDNFIFKYPVYIRVKEFKANIDVYFCHSYASWEKLERFIQKVLIFPQYRKMKLIMKLKKLMRFIGKH